MTHIIDKLKNNTLTHLEYNKNLKCHIHTHYKQYGDNSNIQSIILNKKMNTMTCIYYIFPIFPKHNYTLHTIIIEPDTLNVNNVIYLAKFLKGCRCLHTLHLNYNDVCDIGMSYLSRSCIHKSLNVLKLNKINITHYGIKSLNKILQSNTNICVLDISRNNIGMSSIKTIVNSLKNNNNLQIFNIEGNCIFNEGFKYVVKYLQTNKSLHTLNISHIGIHTIGIKYLAHIIKSVNNLSVLIMKGISLGTNGKYLYNGLKHAHNGINLHTLDISCCKILNNKYIIKIINSINVSVLNISGIHINESNWVLIMKRLNYNHVISKLVLDDINLTDNGMKYLGKLLSKNRSITYLSCKKNHITDKGIKYLGRYMGINTTLYELYLGNNQIQGETIHYLKNSGIKIFNILHNYLYIQIDIIFKILKNNKNVQKWYFNSLMYKRSDIKMLCGIEYNPNLISINCNFEYDFNNIIQSICDRNKHNIFHKYVTLAQLLQ